MSMAWTFCQVDFVMCKDSEPEVTLSAGFVGRVCAFEAESTP